MSNLKALPLIPYAYIFFRRISCGTVSKALFKSINTPITMPTYPRTELSFQPARQWLVEYSVSLDTQTDVCKEHYLNQEYQANTYTIVSQKLLQKNSK